MDKLTNQIISYAIGTEVDAVELYAFILRKAKGNESAIISHILKEELEHIESLLSILYNEV